MSRNNAFWNQLLMRSDSIVGIDPRAADATEQVLAQLSSVTEQFDRVFDPADQFEEFVAVNLCQALQRALTPQPAERTCRLAVQHKAQASPALRPSEPASQTQTPNAPVEPANKNGATETPKAAPPASNKKQKKKRTHRGKNR